MLPSSDCSQFKPTLLIDECLSASIAPIAHARGFVAEHVVQRGWAGLKDWQLLSLIVANSYLFVTNNRLHWLRNLGSIHLHAGLLIIVPSVSRLGQAELFEAALDHLGMLPDLINQVLEVSWRGPHIVCETRPLAATSDPG